MREKIETRESGDTYLINSLTTKEKDRERQLMETRVSHKRH